MRARSNNNVITIRIEGRHGSLSNLEWRGVPPFAVITGVNGTGKSQFLEVIAASHGATPGRDDPQRALSHPLGARAHIEGASFATGEVFHTYGEWARIIGGVTTEEHVKEVVRGLYTSGGKSILQAIAARSGIDVEDAAGLSREEFVNHLTPGLVWAHAWNNAPLTTHTLAFLFLSYRLFERDALGKGASEEEIRGLYGDPPWCLLNEILETSGLPFRVDRPEPIRPTSLAYETNFELRLRDVESGIEVPFWGLSSGERVIMSSVFWQYNARTTGGQYKLLLLDEPDAHLHPSLTRRFLEVIRKVFVEERGVRVIMTTHSPSTVSFVPEESLFEMRRTEPRIEPVQSKERAVAVLTGGFVAVQEATQIVLVEGKEDPPFYNQVWDLLKERSSISEPGPLDPFPGLAFVHGQGKNVVEQMVPQMRSRGLTGFHGIIDKDLGNAPSPGVHVLDRNGMENYLLDPLNVWVTLHLQDEAFAVTSVEVPRGRSSHVRDLPENLLQQIANAVLRKVESSLTHLDNDEKTEEKIVFANGKLLSYPRWFLYRDDKEIIRKFREAFGYRQLTAEKLLRGYATLNMVPQDLTDLLRAIQASSNP